MAGRAWTTCQTRECASWWWRSFPLVEPKWISREQTWMMWRQLGTSIEERLPHRRSMGVDALTASKPTGVHGTGRSRPPESAKQGRGRQISPDAAEATCLLAGQHSRESFGWTRRRRRPSSTMGQAATRTNHKAAGCTMAALSHASSRLVPLCVLVVEGGIVSSSLCRLCCAARAHGLAETVRATCLSYRAHSRAATTKARL